MGLMSFAARLIAGRKAETAVMILQAGAKTFKKLKRIGTRQVRPETPAAIRRIVEEMRPYLPAGFQRTATTEELEWALVKGYEFFLALGPLFKPPPADLIGPPAPRP